MKYIFILLLAHFTLGAQTNDKVRKLAALASDSIPSLGSILVWHKGQIVCEEYFNGAGDQTYFNVKSVTKSVVSALAGIAYDNKLITDLNIPFLKIFPEYDTGSLKEKNSITLKHLLCMQSGIAWGDWDGMKVKVNSDDPVLKYLAQPFEAKPGELFKYSTTGSHLAAVAVARLAKTELKTFADTFLFKPLGFVVNDWPRDKQGRAFGGSELKLRAKDMLQFGLLYLNKGKVNDKQIISESWLKESTSAHVKLEEWDVLPGANGYGYFWWRRKIKGHQAFVASGYGGQLICVIPELETVIVSACFDNDKNRGRSEIKRLHGFFDEMVYVLK